MLIVDGVPISLGYLNSINPNDIATADILKSAGLKLNVHYTFEAGIAYELWMDFDEEDEEEVDEDEVGDDNGLEKDND